MSHDIGISFENNLHSRYGEKIILKIWKPIGMDIRSLLYGKRIGMNVRIKKYI